MSFDRLIRFVGEADQVVYGNLEKALSCNEIVGTEVQVLAGNFEDGFNKTSQTATVKKVRTVTRRSRTN